MHEHRQWHTGAAHQHGEQGVLCEETDGCTAHGAGREELVGHVNGAKEAGDLAAWHVVACRGHGGRERGFWGISRVSTGGRSRFDLLL